MHEEPKDPIGRANSTAANDLHPAGAGWVLAAAWAFGVLVVLLVGSRYPEVLERLWDDGVRVVCWIGEAVLKFFVDYLSALRGKAGL
ncbi:hypothetical protein SAMN04489745_0118 [Arthrobacter woluwensis]|uniref:Uncharacterized protein n=1 Tax=Arthrobacter woluwensis TaxID=156980 RepID=A0A1H4I7X9_9MICC|nr:hypothetical protein SAMN04489745_0118 [Arthrobacter woluwensis]